MSVPHPSSLTQVLYGSFPPPPPPGCHISTLHMRYSWPETAAVCIHSEKEYGQGSRLRLLSSFSPTPKYRRKGGEAGCKGKFLFPPPPPIRLNAVSTFRQMSPKSQFIFQSKTLHFVVWRIFFRDLMARILPMSFLPA